MAVVAVALLANGLFEVFQFNEEKKVEQRTSQLRRSLDAMISS
ncbi:hypothetical protein [Bradyrhizobium frederickii]|nr:hypothetical protein [Bradyrhizobium frederickii]